ncbi:MAG: hypothetical protein HOO67_04545 [Candidatus Peribacteraceae bacterium]|nr:hypothetical protein [Candidatus Peribacteraceae bacterium]
MAGDNAPKSTPPLRGQEWAADKFEKLAEKLNSTLGALVGITVLSTAMILSCSGIGYMTYLDSQKRNAAPPPKKPEPPKNPVFLDEVPNKKTVKPDPKDFDHINEVLENIRPEPDRPGFIDNADPPGMHRGKFTPIPPKQ